MRAGKQRLAQPGTRVYLVDDDAGVRRALTRVLRNAGYQTTAFGTAEDFLIGVELDERIRTGEADG